MADLVFHRGGKPIRDPRHAWDKALSEAGVPRAVWHDFRRTAARNMLNVGVPEKVAMEIADRKTASIFRRHHVAAQTDKAEALRRTFEHVE